MIARAGDFVLYSLVWRNKPVDVALGVVWEVEDGGRVVKMRTGHGATVTMELAEYRHVVLAKEKYEHEVASRFTEWNEDICRRLLTPQDVKDLLASHKPVDAELVQIVVP